MTNKSAIKNLNRDDLKKFFRNGQMPSENHFGYLIDSMINKQDDGFSRDDNSGLILSSSLGKRFVTFYKTMDDLNPFFSMGADEQDEEDSQSLRFTSLKGNPDNKDAQSFFLHSNGNLSVGKKGDKAYKLDVDGFAASEGRVGTFVQGSVPADGRWHDVTPALDNCNAFEIVARTGMKSSGRFAILHAIALSAFGRSRSRIRRTSAHYGFFWNKIAIRWKGYGTHNYVLQLKTKSNYGKDVLIFFKVGKLWDDQMFMPAGYFY